MNISKNVAATMLRVFDKAVYAGVGLSDLEKCLHNHCYRIVHGIEPK